MNGTGVIGDFPLTPAQVAIWLAHQAGPDGAACNTAQYTEIFAAIDRTIFTAAARSTLASTEALWLRFRSAPEGPVQWIGARIAVEDVLTWHDLTADPVPADRARDRIAEFVARSFDLRSEAPLFAWHVFELTDRRFIFLQIYHHLIIDATGRNLVLATMARAFACHARATEPPPGDAKSLRDLLGGGVGRPGRPALAGDRDYWLSLLSNRPAVASLSNRKSNGSFVARRETRHLSPATHAALVGLAKLVSASLPAVIAAAAGLYLARMSGQNEHLLGWMVGGRRRSAAPGIPGNLANQAILRLTAAPGLGIADLVGQARRQTIQALRHRHYPNETLCRELGLDPREQGLFGLLVNHLPRDTVTCFADGPCQTHNVSRGPVRDLRISVAEPPGGGITMELDGNIDCYGAMELASHADRFHRLLGVLAESDPETRLGAIDLLGAAERDKVVVGFNATAHRVPAGTVPSLFESRVARDPTAIALIFGDIAVRAADLDAAANQLARHLVRQGIGPGRVVALVMPRSIEMVVALLGVLKTGASYMPIDPGTPPRRLSYMLANSQAAIMLTLAPAWDAARGADAAAVGLPPVIRLDDPRVRRLIDDEREHPLTDSERRAPLLPDDLVYIMYTSGSTGAPKGVGNTHAGVINRLAWAQDMMRLSAGDRVLQKTPWTFDVSVPEFLHPLIHGAVLVMAPPDAHADPYLLADTIDRFRITSVHFVPSMLAVFLDVIFPRSGLVAAVPPARRFPSLRIVATSGEALGGSVRNRCLANLPVRLWNLYGPTEAAVEVTAWPCDVEADDRPPPIGRPVWNTQTYVLDPDLNPVPIGAVGELYRAGAQLARGYVGQPGLTAERFIACPFGPPGARMYRTGDVARWREDGAIDFVGRADHQIKLHGVRVEPGEIEAALRALPGIAQACVLPTRIRGNVVFVAYLVPSVGAALAPFGELCALLAERLPAAMVPSRFVTLSALPLTANGKLDRRALLAADGGETIGPIVGQIGARTATPWRAARTERETRICRLFAELTGADRVGVDDDFFKLGGNSLLAVKLIVRLRQSEDREVDLRVIFENATPAALARALEQVSNRPQRIEGHRFRLALVRAASSTITARGVLLCLPLLGGGSHHAGLIAPALPEDYDIWRCEFDLQGREDPTGDSWIECARSLARWLLETPAFKLAGLLGFSIGGYLGWLIDRLLVAAGRPVTPLINLDGAALPRLHPDLFSRLHPLLPPGATVARARMLFICRDGAGAFVTPTQADRDWSDLECDVLRVPVSTIRHLDQLDPRVLALQQEVVGAFLPNRAIDEAAVRRRGPVPTAGGRLFEMLARETPPSPEDVGAFIADLPDGPVDPDFELSLMFLALTSCDVDLALRTARRCARDRPNDRNAYYVQVALLLELGRAGEAQAIVRSWCAGRDDDPVLRARAVRRNTVDPRWDQRVGLFQGGARLELALDVAAARCAGTL